jgi:hypothetical protein
MLTCYGLELDPLYVDTIIRRWQAYAGEIAPSSARLGSPTISGQCDFPRPLLVFRRVDPI